MAALGPNVISQVVLWLARKHHSERKNILAGAGAHDDIEP